MTDMTADQILASIGSEVDTHPVNKLAEDLKTGPAKLKTEKVKSEKPVKEPKVKAEKPVVAKEDKSKRIRVTAHEQAMYANVDRLSVALNKNVSVSRSDETRYMRALFNLSVDGTVIARAVTVNEIEMFANFQESVAALNAPAAEVAEAA